MSSFLQRAINAGLVQPPAFLVSNLQYEVVMGSRAYAVNTSDKSDFDIYGFAIPPKDIVFPHLAGIIPGFGKQGQNFEQYHQTHIVNDSNGEEYDFTIYNIIKFFELCRGGNPNMVDALFVPENCITRMTQVGHLVRDARKKFLSKKVWFTFKGYAYKQLHAMDNKNPTGKRKESVDNFGFDVKYAYHIVRLLDECHQILSEGDLDLQRSREQLKSIRRGEWTEEQIKDYFNRRLPVLEDAFSHTKLPDEPDEPALKQVLLNCLETHYGNLSNVIINPDGAVLALREINQILERSKSLIWDYQKSEKEPIAQ